MISNSVADRLVLKSKKLPNGCIVFTGYIANTGYGQINAGLFSSLLSSTIAGMEQAKCELCGEPMPAGEEMFKFHGYSGDCPKPPLPRNNEIADDVKMTREADKSELIRAESQRDLWIERSALWQHQCNDLAAALLPFAAAAGRPGRLIGSNDQPLEDDAILGLGVKVSAWKEAIRLTSAK